MAQQTATEITENTERKLPAGAIPDPLTQRIIGAAIEVHRILGPGLLESVYEQALCHEFELREIKYQRQAHVEMQYKDTKIKDQRIDLIVEEDGDRVVIDLKSLSRLPDISTAQVLSYLKATGLKRGLLINFGEKRLVDGVRRLSL